MPGVRVGHQTVWRGDPGEPDPVIRSGVTAVWPHDGDLFRERVYAGHSVLNGYGEMTSNIVIDEWGLIGSPIVLIDTTHIGLGYDAVVRYMAQRDPEIQDIDVVIPVVAETDDGFLSDNRAFGLSREDVWAALDSASGGPVAEGVVGAAPVRSSSTSRVASVPRHASSRSRAAVHDRRAAPDELRQPPSAPDCRRADGWPGLRSDARAPSRGLVHRRRRDGRAAPSPPAASARAPG